MKIPAKVHVTSDNSELELMRTEKDAKEGEVYVYKFTKSREKLGVEFRVSKRELIKQMHNAWEEIE